VGHNIVDSRAEKIVIDRLCAECGMEELDWRTKDRNKVKGLRIAGLPNADWIDDGPL
jgi:hypothetical protein